MRYIPTTATTILLSIAIMFATLFLLAAPFVMGQSDIPLSQDIQSVLAVNNNSLYHYPTDLTQGIMPKNVHSHNDYWRAKPFYTALSNGVISVEADVWLYNGTLYVCNMSMTANLQFCVLNRYLPMTGWTRDVCIDLCTHIRLPLHSTYSLCPQEAEPQLTFRLCSHSQRSLRHFIWPNSLLVGGCQDQRYYHLALRRQGS